MLGAGAGLEGCDDANIWLSGHKADKCTAESLSRSQSSACSRAGGRLTGATEFVNSELDRHLRALEAGLVLVHRRRRHSEARVGHGAAVTLRYCCSTSTTHRACEPVLPQCNGGNRS